jgi:hypothetical protein
LNVTVLNVMVINIMVVNVMAEARPGHPRLWLSTRDAPGPGPTDHTPNAGAGRWLTDPAKFVAR